MTIRETRLRHPLRLLASAAILSCAAGALLLSPAGNLAWAKNDGSHGHAGDHGNGNGGSGGNSGNGNGHGAGNSGDNGKDDSASAADNGGAGTSSGPQSGDDQQSGSDDGSLSASGLGKLNGFFHASPNALVHASMHSPLGQISRAFRDALSAYASNEQATTTGGQTGTPTGTPSTGPTAEDLGAILGRVTNKPVTAAQVRAIVNRLASLNPDDSGIAALAGNPQDPSYQSIADAANNTQQASQ